LELVETVQKRGGSSSPLTKYTFETVPISVAIELKSESHSVKCRFEMRCGIDKKECVVDIVFCSELAEKDLGECGRGGRK